MPNRPAVVLGAFGDFTSWKREHGTYQKALDRLLCDLRVERA